MGESCDLTFPGASDPDSYHRADGEITLTDFACLEGAWIRKLHLSNLEYEEE